MTTPEGRISPRRPRVAALLSFLMPGLGQVYAGRLVAGLALVFAGSLPGALGPLMLVAGRGAWRVAGWALVAVATGIWVYAVVDAWRLARRAPEDYRLKEYNHWLVYALLLMMVLPFGLANSLLIREYLMKAYVIRGAAMVPTLRSGDRVMSLLRAYAHEPVHRGDVVAFTPPNQRHQTWIRRVIGLPGDRVAVREGRVVLNGEPLPLSETGETVNVTGADGETLERPVCEETLDGRHYRVVVGGNGAEQTPADVAELVVPNGHCYVLADNRATGVDSRTFGPVPLEDIRGRVAWRYLPTWRNLSPK